MNAYLSILRLRFAVQLQYRAAAAAGFSTQLFFGLVKVMVFMAFYASSNKVQPMSLQQAITYSWLVQVTLRMLPWNSDAEVLALIRSGNVAYELCRPLNLYASWYSRVLAWRIVPVLLSGVPIWIIAVVLPAGYGMTLPESLGAGLSFGVSLTASLLLGAAISNIMSISTLWTVAGDGMQRLLPAAVMFFSGTTIPLAFFPDWSQPLLSALPFSGLVDVPFRFYIGTLPPSELLPNLALQLCWTAALIGIGLWLLSTATKRIVLQGG